MLVTPQHICARLRQQKVEQFQIRHLHRLQSRNGQFGCAVAQKGAFWSDQTVPRKKPSGPGSAQPPLWCQMCHLHTIPRSFSPSVSAASRPAHLAG